MTLASASVDSVSVKYGDRTALDGVTFSVGPEVTLLLGVNGAGKTTLLNTLCGLHRPTRGLVRVGDRDPYSARERSAALGKIGLVPQGSPLPDHMRLRDFLSYMAFMRGVAKKIRPSEIERTASAVNLQNYLSSKIGQLSGGMRRRALIAQALLGNPEVLLCDEPTVGLDPEQRASIRRLLTELGSSHAVLVASHIVEDAEYMADRVVVLHEGVIAFQGQVVELQSEHGGQQNGGAGSPLEHAFLALVRGNPL